MQHSRITSKRKLLGQGMTEYIIIVALIAIAAIGVFTYFGQTARNQVAGMAQELSGHLGTTAIQAAGTAAGNAETQGRQDKNLSNYEQGNIAGSGGGSSSN